MPANKKPRKAYRPKARLVNPMDYVLEGFAPVSSAGSYLVDLKLHNHSAMTELLAGWPGDAQAHGYAHCHEQHL